METQYCEDSETYRYVYFFPFYHGAKIQNKVKISKKRMKNPRLIPKKNVISIQFYLKIII